MVGDPIWLTTEEVVAVHDNQIALYGGLPGTKDPGLVDSAVHAPRNTFEYDEERDVLMLGLVLCRAVTKGHGFLDGNKRTAAASMLLFLAINGYDLIIPDDDPDAPWLGRMIETMTTDDLPLPDIYAALVPYLHYIE